VDKTSTRAVTWVRIPYGCRTKQLSKHKNNMAIKPTYDELCRTIDILLRGISKYQEENKATLGWFFAGDNLKEVTDLAEKVLQLAQIQQ